MSDQVYQQDDHVTFQFCDKFTRSFRFSDFFQEGMLLVMEVGTYLDEEGRVESRSLSRAASLVYATESMKLTTRLMRLTSWLLLHQDLFEGKSSAQIESQKVELEDPFAIPHEDDGVYDELPKGLRTLIDRSLNFYTRMKVIDQMLCLPHKLEGDFANENVVLGQVARLQNFFDGSDNRRPRQSQKERKTTPSS